jgi:hypothetical protein
MKRAVLMGSDAMIYVRSFMKNGSGIQKFMDVFSHTAWWVRKWAKSSDAGTLIDAWEWRKTVEFHSTHREMVHVPILIAVREIVMWDNSQSCAYRIARQVRSVIPFGDVSRSPSVPHKCLRIAVNSDGIQCALCIMTLRCCALCGTRTVISLTFRVTTGSHVRNLWISVFVYGTCHADGNPVSDYSFVIGTSNFSKVK